jgi:hypothetical protein
MSNPYCQRADVYKYGFPRGLLANPGRRCASVNATTDKLELDGHGFETDTPVMFRAEGSGSLPSPLLASTTYYAIRVTDSAFQVALVAGGAAINLTSTGTAVLVATPLAFDDVIEFYSRWADDFLPANAVPLNPVPVVVRGLVAELAAKKLLLLAGQSSQSMDAQELAAKAQLERYAKGIPLRDTTAVARTNLAHSEGVVSDPRGWTRGGQLP